MKNLFLNSMILVAVAAYSTASFGRSPVLKNPSARLEAELHSGLVKELKASLVFKMENGNSNTWVVETWTECPEYPCTPADYMTSEIFSPEVIEDSRRGDGPLILKLGTQLTITMVSGFLPTPSEQTPYSLKFEKNGKVHVIPLELSAGIRTGFR